MSVRRTAVAVAVAALAVACKKEAAPPAAPEPNVVVINASDFAFTAPDSIPAGVTRLRLVSAGPSIHHAQLLKLNDGKTYDTLVAALSRPMQGPPPSWLVEIGSPNPPATGDTAEVITNLEAGHYAIVCFVPDSAGKPHFVSGMMRPLEVTAVTGPAAAEPTADVEISLTDYAFTESVPLTAGRHTIKVTNNGPQVHEMFIAKLDSGATTASTITWMEHGMHGRPPIYPMGGVAGMANGAHAYVVANLTPGNYGLFCFVPDSKDGKEHYKHGMVRQITVN